MVLYEFNIETNDSLLLIKWFGFGKRHKNLFLSRFQLSFFVTNFPLFITNTASTNGTWIIIRIALNEKHWRWCSDLCHTTLFGFDQITWTLSTLHVLVMHSFRVRFYSAIDIDIFAYIECGENGSVWDERRELTCEEQENEVKSELLTKK